MDGLRFFASLHGNNINGANLDQMGCGKTLQTLAFFAYLKETKQVKGIHLVLAPLSIVREWVESVATFVPSLQIAVINSEEDWRNVRFSNQNDNSGFLFSHKWHYVVVDEAHKAVANPTTATAQSIHKIPFHNRLVLTGTPLNSDVQELWSLLQFLNPDIFCSGEETEMTFDEVFRKPFENLVAPPPKKNSNNIVTVSKETLQSEASALRLEPEERDLVVMRLHQILKPFVIRRTKLDIDVSLRITFHTIWCPLSSLQVKLLNLLRGLDDKNSNNINGDHDQQQQQQQQQDVESTSHDSATTTISNSYSSYKKPSRILPIVREDGTVIYQRGNSIAANALSICNHPFMCGFLPELMRRKNISEQDEEEILLRSSGKLCVLDALLAHLHKQGRQAVVFSHYLETIDILENHFIARGWGQKFVSLTGATTPEQRAAGVRRFREHPADCFIFLLSMKAGGCGLNLQSADTIILYDRDYTATNEDQAISRVFRMGQKNVVRAIYLMTKDENETRVAAIAENKDRPRKEIIDGGSYQIQNELEEGEIGVDCNNLDENDDHEDYTLPLMMEKKNNEEEVDTTENDEEKLSKKNQKSRKDGHHQLQEIDCENIHELEQTLTRQVFQGFLNRTVPRDEEDKTTNNNNDNSISLLQQADNKEEQVPSTSFVTLPYYSFDSLHPVVLSAFAECEEHERLDIEGNDQLGVGKRKKKKKHNVMRNEKRGDDDDDNTVDDVENNEEESSDDDDLEMMFLDSVPAFGVLEKIMEEEEFSDEEDALDFWRDKQIEKEKTKRRAKIIAKKLQEQFGAEIDFENSFSMFVEAFPEKINNLPKHQLKSIKSKFSLRQFTLKTRTQYRSDFLNEMKELFLKKHKSFLEK
jgi:hypothetical protein